MSDVHPDSFGSRARLTAGATSWEIFRLDALEKGGAGSVSRLPWSLRILLENLLRLEDGQTVTREDIAALAGSDPSRPVPAEKQREIAFMPARVLLQDFTGVPAVADLAAMRDALVRLGGDPARVNPLQPADLVIDHSVQVDAWGTADAFRQNAEIEFSRNRERYLFLRWGQQAFRNFHVVPPDTGIVHQVNLEHLAPVVFRRAANGGPAQAYPDTLVGTDSHTTMINGLGVLGWGVGGIEAEAAMLGQPITMLIPEVVGFRLSGSLPAGSTATDLVLTITQRLRAAGVVGKFVEFFGPGLDALSLPDRATIANMAPEYGATMGFFPVDAETLRYLRLTGRPADGVELVERYCREQGLFRTAASPEPAYAQRLELDLATIEPSLAGPRRPQDRVPLGRARASFAEALPQLAKDPKGPAALPAGGVEASHAGQSFRIGHGAVVIAAITSCTNTSNPAVLIGAGLLARKAVARGLRSKPWVKTSLAPGSLVVMDYLEKAGLRRDLEALGFHLVGFGCTTCIGNSGPLPEAIASAISGSGIVAAAVLSGNRNFEGRINPHVRANYLASPPLVVAYALAGTIDIDLTTGPLGTDTAGRPVFLKEIWPSQEEIAAVAGEAIDASLFSARYADIFAGDERWRSLEVPPGQTYAWTGQSTYIRRPPFFDGLEEIPAPQTDIAGARVLALLGDSVTTDHISPAGSIAKEGPAGRWLVEHGVAPADFNSYGARRGNHEVMVRGTFANIRLRNLLAPGTEGGVTEHLAGGGRMSIYDAAVRYMQEGTPLVILAGKEYGTGSSRDWAAKGTKLLGVRAVLAESFERIHRSNLAGMGVLPLQYLPGQSAATLGLTGREIFSISGIARGLAPMARVMISVSAGGAARSFEAVARLDTPREVDYFRHGGILPYVLRSLARTG